MADPVPIDEVLRSLHDEVGSHTKHLASLDLTPGDVRDLRGHLARALQDSLSDLEAEHHTDHRIDAPASSMATAQNPKAGRAISPATRALAARIVVDASRKSGQAVPSWISAIANQPS